MLEGVEAPFGLGIGARVGRAEFGLGLGLLKRLVLDGLGSAPGDELGQPGIVHEMPAGGQAEGIGAAQGDGKAQSRADHAQVAAHVFAGLELDALQPQFQGQGKPIGHDAPQHTGKPGEQAGTKAPVRGPGVIGIEGLVLVVRVLFEGEEAIDPGGLVAQGGLIALEGTKLSDPLVFPAHLPVAGMAVGEHQPGGLAQGLVVLPIQQEAQWPGIAQGGLPRVQDVVFQRRVPRVFFLQPEEGEFSTHPRQESIIVFQSQRMAPVFDRFGSEGQIVIHIQVDEHGHLEPESQIQPLKG